VDESVALKCGIVTLISFMVFGALPSVPYIISSGILSLDTQQEIAVIVIGAVELFVLGFAKASLIGLNPWKSGMETLILGSAIVGIAYGIGIVLK
jgi:VIT1/CCC1 family predicted Fe2+/Mn2+ transporter